MVRSLMRLALMLLASMLVFGGSAAAFQTDPATPAALPEPRLPAVVEDVNGASVTVEDVSRIVPLSGDIAEIVWTLGLGAEHRRRRRQRRLPGGSWAQLPQIGFERQLSAEGHPLAQPDAS